MKRPLFWHRADPYASLLDGIVRIGDRPQRKPANHASVPIGPTQHAAIVKTFAMDIESVIACGRHIVDILAFTPFGFWVEPFL
jgi:hypothetical protein